MSDRGSRDRQVMTLLVQLFGRDVMDRLAGAGFDAPAAMARAGAEKLAAEAGIPIAIARRVAIVVEESPAPAPAATPKPAAAAPARSAAAHKKETVAQPDVAARAEASPRSKPVERGEVGLDETEMLMDSIAPSEPVAPSEPAAREELRPAKPAARKREPRVSVESITPHIAAAPPPAVASQSVPPPAESASPPPAPSAATASTATSAVRDSISDEGDPFVDDVALVSWMGLSSHQPDGRLAFTVSDTILDPAGPGDSAQEERNAAGNAAPENPRPAAAPLEMPARPSTISGSFWTFGRPADQTPPAKGPEPESQPPASSPRRRKYDGH